mmetsp:Transcript_24300/g.58178  ORF Transcript_24300/g.58178 Transcript_24300/m.58178 type:complete len:217 (-) Transcript_24300:114-764(-)
MRPQSAAVRGNPRVGGLSRPQSAPLAREPKLLSRAELDEISQKMYDRGAAYAARRDKLRDDHIDKLNGWKLRVEVRPAVYGGEMRFKYMSECSKLALDEGRTYESEGKTWRKNVVSEAERKQYIDHFYGDARRKKVEKIKMLTERAKRRIDSQQLCNFTALDKQTKHELMVNKQLPTLGTVYAARNVVDMDEDAFKSLVQQDRRQPPAPIWSLGQK